MAVVAFAPWHDEGVQKLGEQIEFDLKGRVESVVDDYKEQPYILLEDQASSVSVPRQAAPQSARCSAGIRIIAGKRAVSVSLTFNDGRRYLLSFPYSLYGQKKALWAALAQRKRWLRLLDSQDCVVREVVDDEHIKVGPLTKAKPQTTQVLTALLLAENLDSSVEMTSDEEATDQLIASEIAPRTQMPQKRMRHLFAPPWKTSRRPRGRPRIHPLPDNRPLEPRKRRKEYIRGDRLMGIRGTDSLELFALKVFTAPVQSVPGLCYVFFPERSPCDEVDQLCADLASGSHERCNRAVVQLLRYMNAPDSLRLKRLTLHATQYPYEAGVYFDVVDYVWKSKVDGQERKYLIKKHGWDKAREKAVAKVHEMLAVAPKAVVEQFQSLNNAVKPHLERLHLDIRTSATNALQHTGAARFTGVLHHAGAPLVDDRDCDAATRP